MNLSDNRRFINSIINKPSSKNLDDRKVQYETGFSAIFPETEENINCLQHIEYGGTIHEISGHAVFSLHVSKKNILLSDIMNAIEDMEEIPEEISDYFTNLVTEEWQASLRAITIILIALECF